MPTPVVTGTPALISHGAGPHTVSMTSTADPLYAVFNEEGGTPASGVTWEGPSGGPIACTRQTLIPTAATGFHNFEVWSLVNPVAGAGSLVITYPGGSVVGRVFNVANGPNDGSIQVPVAVASFNDHDPGVVVPSYGPNSLAFGFTVGTVSTSGAGQIPIGTIGGTDEGGLSTLPGGDTNTFTWTLISNYDWVTGGFAIPDGSHHVSGGMCQQWMSRLVCSAGSDYCALPTGRSFYSSFGIDDGTILEWGTIRSLRIDLDTAPGVGKTRTFTVLRNGNATGLTVTISGDTDVTATISVDQAFYKYDRLCIQNFQTGSPGTVPMSYCIEVESDDQQASVYGSGVSDAGLGTGEVRYQGPLFTIASWENPAAHRENLVASAGNLTEYLIRLPYGMQRGDNIFDFVVFKDGIAQDGSGGTIDTRLQIIYNNGTPGSAYDPNPTIRAQFSLPVIVGTLLKVRCTLTSNLSSNIIRPAMAARIEANIPGEYTIGGGARPLHTSDERWMPAPANDQESVTETDWPIVIGPTTQAFSVQGIVARLGVAPGGSASWTISNRLNRTTPAGATLLVLPDANIDQAVGDLPYVNGNILNMQLTPSGEPAIPDSTIWALRGFSLVPSPFVEDFRQIRRVRTFPLPSSPDQEWTYCSAIEILLQAGMGLTAGDAADPAVQGSDPQVMFQLSRDGGLTWGPEQWRSAGPQGAYKRRVRFLRQGRWRNGVGRVIVSDPVKWVLIDCFAELEQGDS